jgi:hypothetical protein
METFEPPLNEEVIVKSDVSNRTVAWMVSGMILLVILLFAIFLVYLPETREKPIKLTEAQWLVLVAAAGGLGAYVHMAHSFVTYIGLEKVKRSWLWWYAMRPFIGMALALIFFLIYGASATPPNAPGGANPYAILAIAAVVGMFSKQAIEKLAELFDVILKSDTGQNLKSKDSMTHAREGEAAGDGKNATKVETNVSAEAITGDPAAVG